MAELVQENWMLLVAALVVGILVAWWIFVASRRTRVEIAARDEDLRPERNQSLIDAPPAAAFTEMPPPVPEGLGPKLVDQLRELGVTSFAQIAAWDDAEIDRIDAQLGRFQGRIRRDDWPAQARFLAAGDTAGYEAKFGKL